VSNPFKRVNGWLLDQRADEVWIRDPDQKLARVEPTWEEATQWANAHDEYNMSKRHHSRGNCGLYIKRGPFGRYR
jgi:hypothetical protein